MMKKGSEFVNGSGATLPHAVADKDDQSRQLLEIRNLLFGEDLASVRQAIDSQSSSQTSDLGGLRKHVDQQAAAIQADLEQRASQFLLDLDDLETRLTTQFQKRCDELDSHLDAAVARLEQAIGSTGDQADTATRELALKSRSQLSQMFQQLSTRLADVSDIAGTTSVEPASSEAVTSSTAS